ncbi:MAG: TRAP transporter substrate-binding protein [Candidatus Velthaea sp.]
MIVTRRTMLASAGALGAAALWPTPLLAAPRTIKIGHTLSPDSHYQKAALRFGDLLRSGTGGAYELQAFPQSQIGGEAQMLQAARAGAQELVISSTPPMVATIKEFEFFDAPFLFDNIEHANKAIATIGDAFHALLPAHDLVGLTFLSMQERDIFSAGRPIRTLEDMKNLKIRVIQSPGYVESYRALGANPTPMPYGQLYLALKEKTVDAAENTSPQFFQDKFVELCRTFTLNRTHITAANIVAGKWFWDSLDAKTKVVFQDAAHKAAVYDTQIFVAETQTYLDKMKGAGVEVIKIDSKPWVEATAAVRKRFVAAHPQGDKLVDKIAATRA